jgi:hypothetical protein
VYKRQVCSLGTAVRKSLPMTATELRFTGRYASSLLSFSIKGISN